MIDLLYKIYVRFLIFIGDMGWSGWKRPFWITVNLPLPKLKGKDYLHVRSIIQPGDIMLRTSWNFLDSLIIPSKWVHAGIYLGGSEEQIIHAVSEGVIIEHLSDFMRTDQMMILRPPSSMVESGLSKARGIVGRDYDFSFDTQSTTAFYCSEVPNYCYPGLFVPKKRFNKETVTGDDIEKCVRLTIIWDSRLTISPFSDKIVVRRPKF